MKNKNDLKKWIANPIEKPLFIGGPCSAEDQNQVLSLAKTFREKNYVQFFRAGVWKPRTMPGLFEGRGEMALPWLVEVKRQFKFPLAIEVANAKHVLLAIEYGIDVLWIGARTTVNPFSVQEIVDTLVNAKAQDTIIMIKNPMHVDFSLWVGAIERFKNSGLHNLIAVHRGFNIGEEGVENKKYRNAPVWKVPFELRRKYPDLPILCDPSHITGRSDLIAEVSQKALDFGFNGLMIEAHPFPKNALSDAKQQITPQELNALLETLKIRKTYCIDFEDELYTLRKKIDDIDHEILDTLALRSLLTKRIGIAKTKHNMCIFQPERLQEMMEKRKQDAELLGLSPDYIKEIFQTIHEESVRLQTDVCKTDVCKTNIRDIIEI